MDISTGGPWTSIWESSADIIPVSDVAIVDCYVKDGFEASLPWNTGCVGMKSNRKWDVGVTKSAQVGLSLLGAPTHNSPIQACR